MVKDVKCPETFVTEALPYEWRNDKKLAMEGTYETTWLHSPRTRAWPSRSILLCPSVLLRFKSVMRTTFGIFYYSYLLSSKCSSMNFILSHFCSKFKILGHRILRHRGHVLCPPINSLICRLRQPTICNRSHILEYRMSLCLDKRKLPSPQNRLIIILSCLKCDFIKIVSICLQFT